MVRKNLWRVAVAMAMVSTPVLSFAQSTNNTAPVGSLKNPIKGTLVSTTAPASSKSSKGKRGSKTNPIAGNTHPRGTKPN